LVIEAVGLEQVGREQEAAVEGEEVEKEKKREEAAAAVVLVMRTFEKGW
jgi:hypothetical protein